MLKSNTVSLWKKNLTNSYTHLERQTKCPFMVRTVIVFFVCLFVFGAWTFPATIHRCNTYEKTPHSSLQYSRLKPEIWVIYIPEQFLFNVLLGSMWVCIWLVLSLQTLHEYNSVVGLLSNESIKCFWNFFFSPLFMKSV